MAAFKTILELEHRSQGSFGNGKTWCRQTIEKHLKMRDIDLSTSPVSEMACNANILFGGPRKWTAAEWTASDDRVRGGKSQSYLNLSSTRTSATFSGNLNIKTLGGAGFASQRTAEETKIWDLSHYDGILLRIEDSDGKRYALILKDELLPLDPSNGREQATTSYEFDFSIPNDSKDSRSSVIFIPWSSFKATYRGRHLPDARALDISKIRRFSLMMRSYFGDQEGPFKLSIQSISSVRQSPGLSKDGAERSSLKDSHTGKIFGDIDYRGDVDAGHPKREHFVANIKTQRTILLWVILAFLTGVIILGPIFKPKLFQPNRVLRYLHNN